MEKKGMLRIINTLSRINESTARTRHYKCSRCSGISEGYTIPDGVEEVCPLCDVELTADDKYYEAELSITPIRECADLTEEEQEDLKDEIDELEGTRNEYIELVSESRLYKARKLLEDTDTTVIVDKDGITDDGDVEEDAISVQKTVEIDGEEVKLQVDGSSTDGEYQEGKIDDAEKLAESLRRARDIRRNRMIESTKSKLRRHRMNEEEENDFPNVANAINSTFIDYTFDVASLTTTPTENGLVADVIVKGTEDSAKAYIDDIIEEIGSKSDMLVSYQIVSTESEYVGLALTFTPMTNEDTDLEGVATEIEKSADLIDEIKDEVEDKVEEVVESHRRRYRNAVLREALAEDYDDLDIDDEEDIKGEGEDLENDLESAVESAFRKFRRRVAGSGVSREDFEKAKKAIVREVGELTESATSKRLNRRKRLVESATKYTVEDVIDNDEDILSDLEDQVNETTEDELDDISEMKDLTKKEREDVLIYLDDLRSSGAIDMNGAVPYIQKEFGYSKGTAVELFYFWVETFPERHK